MITLKPLFTTLLNKVSSGVESEPHLLVLDNERLRLKTANATEDARLDIKSNGFWRHGQDAYFDVRVTHVNATSYRNRDTTDIFREHELAKKREYLQRVPRNTAWQLHTFSHGYQRRDGRRM